MYKIQSRKIVEELRREYPEGTRVEPVQMNDEYTKLKSGDKGTVRCVDDMGTIHISWDNGSCLGVAYGEDSCRKLVDKTKN